MSRATVRNERIEDSTLYGCNNVEYVKYFVHLEDVELSYRGFNRLIVNRTAANNTKSQTDIRPTVTNAVVLGAEDGLIALLDAEELQIQFDDLVTKYDRPRAEAFMGVHVKGQNLTASLPEKAQKAMDIIFQANANESSKLIKVFKFPAPKNSNMNIRFGAPVVEFQAHQVPDPCPVSYDKDYKLIYRRQDLDARKNGTNIENRGKERFDHAQNSIAKSISALSDISIMSTDIHKISAKMDAKLGSGHNDAEFGSGSSNYTVLENAPQIYEAEIFDLDTAIATIRKLKLEKAKIIRKAKEDFSHHLKAQALIGNRLREVSSQLSETVNITTKELLNIKDVLEKNQTTVVGLK